MLEYACTVWDPHTKDHIKIIEAIQWRAARFVNNNYHRQAGVEQMIKHLGWTSLQSRRKIARLAILYKIRLGLVHVNFERAEADGNTKLRAAISCDRRLHSQQNTLFSGLQVTFLFATHH